MKSVGTDIGKAVSSVRNFLPEAPDSVRERVVSVVWDGLDFPEDEVCDPISTHLFRKYLRRASK